MLLIVFLVTLQNSKKYIYVSGKNHLIPTRLLREVFFELKTLKKSSHWKIKILELKILGIELLR